ncbi:hypothetical protein K470DRAFT_289737 [Piedraia hortae CBS 480.64]|uniref:Uncharacterized protein n=1 Tax=Piedraia hortae CBS 480.64 TaxID=1314780 RepID=A0A6A7BSH7_9PEZI|nr:hypothetical protein K470DRAFT_289737 [Piedraia hortae CBS 480.64]
MPPKLENFNESHSGDADSRDEKHDNLSDQEYVCGESETASTWMTYPDRKSSSNLTGPLTPSRRSSSSPNIQPYSHTQCSHISQPNSSSSPGSSSDQQSSFPGPVVTSNQEQGTFADTLENNYHENDRKDPILAGFFKAMLNYMATEHNLTSDRDRRLLAKDLCWFSAPYWMAPALNTMEELYKSKGDPYRPEYFAKLHDMSRNYVDLRVCLELVVAQHGTLMESAEFEDILEKAGEELAKEQAGS